MKNPLLASMEGEPIAIDVGRRDWLESCLTSLLNDANAQKLLQEPQMSSEDTFWYPPDDYRAAYRPYVVKQGVLYIPVRGVLLNRFGYQFGDWATGYTYIQKAFERGLADDEVRGIAFIHDSGGGMVSGCFELCEKLFEARGQKSMRSFSAERMYSASYAIGCAPGEISMTRTAGVGSIGVVTLHFDYSGALSQAGIKATFIQAGKFKTDGNSLEPLSRRAKARIQARIDETMEIFAESVARARGLTTDAVKSMEADVFGAKEALTVGLADKVEVFEAALIDFTNSCNSSNDGDHHMSDKATTFSQTQMDEAVASATTSAKAAGVEEGRKAGATAEKARVTAILASDEGKVRPKAALHTALQSEMSVDAAKAFLAGLDEEKQMAAAPAPAGKQQATGVLGAVFDAAMNKSGNPDIAAEGVEEKDEANTPEAVAGGILAAYRGVTGRGQPKK